MTNRCVACKRYIFLSVTVITVTLIVAEAFCYIYYLELERQWSVIKSSINHYYAKSPIIELGYILKPNVSIVRDGKSLKINDNGLRVSVKPTSRARSIVALLGDSIVFGVGFSDENTLPSLLQNTINSHGDAVGVENFGVPGYASLELLKLLQLKSNLVRPTKIVYVLNANDFTRRDSVYEGADNGLFRFYNPPASKALWIFRKSVYRLKKSRTLGTTISHNGAQIISWYKWLFQGNKDAVFEDIQAMKRFCDTQNIGIAVLPVPPGSALGEKRFALYKEYDQLYKFLKDSNIPVIDVLDQLSAELFDDTDHLTVAGNKLLAKSIWKYLRKPEQ